MDTRDIDFEVSRRAVPGQLTVLGELKILQVRGLVERVERARDDSFVGWKITPRGEHRLADLTQ